MVIRIFAFLLIYCSIFLPAVGQKKDKIKYKADKLTNLKIDGVRLKKLIGNVLFTQKGVKVYCDSSYYNSRKNTMEGFGHVRIIDDSVTITSRKLIYNGNKGSALLRKDVIYRRGKKVLYTDFLDYDLNNDVAKFSKHGKLVDEENTLTSKRGSFYGKRDYAIFYDDVLLVSKDFNLKSDTLEYSTLTKIAVTKGPTFIENRDGTTVHSDGGRFFTASDQTTFARGTIETRSYIIVGDHLYADEQKKMYRAVGNVVMTSKKDNVLILGEQATYDKNQGVSKVWGNPLMKRVMKRDTMYISADTLIALENVDKDKERILAFFNLKIFKTNLQGICDSLAYFLADSTMQMYGDPVLWNLNSQMSSDTVALLFRNDLIDQMELRKNAFLISEDTLGQHNQIKGRYMVGDFVDGHISTMDVDGNGESHYFVLEGDSLILGMNKMFCSRMKIRFKNSVLDNISFYTNPEAKFIPPHELSADKQFLEGFNWQITKRPEKQDVISRSKKASLDTDTQVSKKSLKNSKAGEARPNAKTINKPVLRKGAIKGNKKLLKN